MLNMAHARVPPRPHPSMQPPEGSIACATDRAGAVCRCSGLAGEGEFYPFNGCTQFVRCTDGLGLPSVLQDCAPGTLWDPDMGTCRWDCVVAARLSPSPPCTTCVYSYRS